MQTEPVAKTSTNLLDERIEQLRLIFPEAFAEGRVDFDKLQESLGDLIDDRPERYTFNWAGKRDAIRLLQTPTRATLIPDQEESVNFDDTQNLFIEGDNLEVLKLLYKPYFGWVKMIYIDPPYNTGGDFVYPDNYADPLETYLQLTGQKDTNGNLLTSNPETSGRYHSAWLSMMYPRLFLARQLLKEAGVIFVSTDDNEVHNLRLLLNEVFGEENFITSVAWQKKVSPSNDARHFSSDHDYLLVYAKSKEIWRPFRLPMNERQRNYYKNPDDDSRGPWNSATYTTNKSKEQRPNLYYPIKNPNTGEEVWPKPGTTWKYSKEQHRKHVEEDIIYWGVDGRASMPRKKIFLSEAGNVVPRSVWPYSEVGHTQEAMQEFRNLFPGVRFDTPKPTRLIKRILQLATGIDTNDLVLDFFAGSCVTAQAVLELNREDGSNRRFITVQLPEPTDNEDFPTIADIGKERIRRVIAKMKESDEGKLDLMPDEDLGFKVFKLAESNFRPWKGVDQDNSDAYAQQMTMFTDPLVDNWETHDVIYEVALKEGYGLGCQIKRLTDISDNTVYQVTDLDKEQSFYICLDKTLHTNTIRALNMTKDDLFICRDIALDDETAANLALQCRLKTI